MIKKLLQINTTLNVGSTGRIADQISRRAQNDGWNVVIAHGGRYVGDGEIPSIQVSTKLDNYIHAAKGEFLGQHGLGSTALTKRFVKWVDEYNPDIVHLHNIHGYYLNYSVLFEYLAHTNIPIVWTLHDCWSFTGHCTHFENAECKKWLTECHHCPLLMAQYKSRIIDRSRKNYLLKKSLYSQLQDVTIVPVSQWLGDLVIKSILGHFPVHVIHNGIDIDMFRPRQNDIRNRFNIPQDKMIILGVVGSGFNEEKGETEFLELSKRKDFQVILIGMTTEEKKHLPNNIIALGRTSNQTELAEFYSAADVFLNPTYNDTFPTTNLEALACGTPVVTYRTGGSPEAIDENTGIVVDKGNMKDLEHAVQEFGKIGKQKYSKACRERAIKYFNKDDCFEQYIELYNILMDKKQKL